MSVTTPVEHDIVYQSVVPIIVAYRCRNLRTRLELSVGNDWMIPHLAGSFQVVEMKAVVEKKVEAMMELGDVSVTRLGDRAILSQLEFLTANVPQYVASLVKILTILQTFSEGF